jgi:hypothetical protein
VSLHTRLVRALIGALIVVAAVVSVGLTAPAEGPFTIGVHPDFFRLDPESVAQSRASALGLDVDVKFGSMHLHFKWSAIPLAPPTTKSPADLL